MKNIVFVLPERSLPVPNVRGGAIESLLTLLLTENEQNSGYTFHFLMCKNKSLDAKDIDYSAYKHSKFYDFYASNTHFKVNKFVNAVNKRLRYVFPLYSSFDRFVIKKIDEINPDFIVFEGSYGVVAKKLSKKYGREKMALHIHHRMMPKYDVSKYFGKLICVSNFIKQDWLDTFKFSKNIQVEVLLNAIDKSLFSKKLSAKEKSDLLSGLGFSNEDFIVLFVGRLIKEKGIYELISAIKNINDESIKLLVVGSSGFDGGVQTKFTQKLKLASADIEDRIKFTGYVKNYELYKYYGIANLHAAPSLCEDAAPLILLESRTVGGVQQLITNSGGMREYCSKNAIIVDKNDSNFIQNLANKIVECKNNPKKLSDTDDVMDSKQFYSSFCNLIDKFIS